MIGRPPAPSPDVVPMPAATVKPMLAVPPSTLHIVAIPLIILSTLAVGFILVYLKDLLVPFVVAMFFVYLLRPLVDLLTRPCASCCHNSCIDSNSGSGEDDLRSLRRSKEASGKSASAKRRLPVSRGKTPPLHRQFWDPEELTVTFCRVCTFTRCPRWVAVLIALSVVFGVLSMLVLMVADAIQSLEGDDIKMYHDSATKIADKTLSWTNLIFHVDGSSLLKIIRTELPIADLVRQLLLTLFDAIGNTFLILLLVLYLLFEQSAHPAGSLKRKIDDQIQAYIGIKTAISALAGFLVWVVLGPMLGVNLAHLFGVLTFFFNFIPNVGAVIATAFPLPLILLDLRLSTTAKLLAVALPTAIHLIVGNIVEPKVFGKSLELHPVIVLLSLGFWFSIWGVVGAILSIPVTAVLRIVLSHFNHPYAQVIIRLLEGHLGGLEELELVTGVGEPLGDEISDVDEEAGFLGPSVISGGTTRVLIDDKVVVSDSDFDGDIVSNANVSLTSQFSDDRSSKRH